MFINLTLSFAVKTTNGEVSSKQHATERIIVGGPRSDIYDDVDNGTTERDHQPATMTFEFDSSSIEVQLSLL